MKRSFVIFVAVSIVVMASLVHASVSENVVLKIGHIEKLAGGSTIKFIEVVEDSRCPEGTTCIWAGRAIIRVEVTADGKESRTVDLEVGNKESTARFDKLSITAVKLDPYPQAEKATSPGAYVATLLINNAEKAKCE